MSIRADIENYKPWNDQEEKDRRAILRFLDMAEAPFSRENTLAHMTASSWIVNRERTKVLLCYHTIYDSWSWTGGHADGNPDLLAVAVKEAAEETGIRSGNPVSKEIFSLEILTVDGHEKHGAYVSSHLHMNITYLLEADENDELKACEGENSAVRWFLLEEAPEASSEPWMVRRIYRKLNEKLCGKLREG
jgi:8-oxo-dGTP pyrophosphatase MutT (NUDIX family)